MAGPPSARHDTEFLDGVIYEAAHRDRAGPPRPGVRDELMALLIEGMGLEGGREQVRGRLSSLLQRDVAKLLRNGWGPDEIPHAVKRFGGATAAAISAAMVTDVVHRQGGSAGNRAAPDVSGHRAKHRVLDHSSAGWACDVVAAIEALTILGHLPALPDLGQLAERRRPGHAPQDERLFVRIRGLLSKAESSDYPEEADAFMAKAQELMTRHCVDRAMLEAAGGDTSDQSIVGRRIWLDDPYREAKALLLANVAAANRCQAIFTSGMGFSTVLGHRIELEATELLFTSLLVQATRQLTALGNDEVQRARTRRASYRRSFLVAYAVRIGQRLCQANSSATAAADRAMGNRLLPVLASRNDHIEKVADELFGAERDHRQIPLTNVGGWAAGTAAADLADLGLHESIRGCRNKREVGESDHGLGSQTPG